MTAEPMEPAIDLRTTTERLLFRDATAEDTPGLAALYDRVFVDGGAPARGMASWRWRYAAAANEQRSCVAVDRDTGAIVAHVGGRVRPALWRGEPSSAIECVDDMVARPWRNGLARTTLFARLKLHWVERNCGGHGVLFGWGFPNRTAWRIGRRAASYRSLLSCRPLFCLGEPRTRGRKSRLHVARRRRVPVDVDQLWQRCAREIRFGTVRDDRYLSWRYGPGADASYWWVTARDPLTGVLRGATVLRSGGLVPDGVMLMEWLVPAADEAAADALLAGVARFVRRARMAGVAVWLPEWVPQVQRFAAWGFEPRDSDMRLVGRSWDPEVEIDELRAAYYATFGDMDTF